jgi:hypothetical protein
MKITNDTEGAREYPAFAVILQPGESFDDSKNTKVSAPIVLPTSSVAPDSTEEEVK